MHIACEARGGVLVYHKAGLPVAAARSVAASGIGIYLNVVTPPMPRGVGYGRAVMGAALNWVALEGGLPAKPSRSLAGNAPARQPLQLARLRRSSIPTPIGARRIGSRW